MRGYQAGAQAGEKDHAKTTTNQCRAYGTFQCATLTVHLFPRRVLGLVRHFGEGAQFELVVPFCGGRLESVEFAAGSALMRVERVEIGFARE